MSSDSFCVLGLHRTNCAAEFNNYTLQVITGPLVDITRGHKKSDSLGTREIGRTYSMRRCCFKTSRLEVWNTHIQMTKAITKTSRNIRESEKRVLRMRNRIT
jgi:hypothetical protein